MNELLKRLFKEAGMDDPTFSVDDGYTSPEAEKFAELIIRECVEWMADMQYDDGTAIKSLLKHFGIDNETNNCSCEGCGCCHETAENTDTQNS